MPTAIDGAAPGRLRRDSARTNRTPAVGAFPDAARTPRHWLDRRFAGAYS